MRLVAQRVVQPGTAPDRKTGVNAYCYLHPDLTWVNEPPEDLERGRLAAHIIEVDPPRGNRVRSFLEVVAPDRTSDRDLAATVQSGAELLAASGERHPWRLTHGEVAFEFQVEAPLAQRWQVELRVLLGYALAVRREA